MTMDRASLIDPIVSPVQAGFALFTTEAESQMTGEGATSEDLIRASAIVH